jgi:hypothetical protein
MRGGPLLFTCEEPLAEVGSLSGEVLGGHGWWRLHRIVFGFFQERVVFVSVCRPFPEVVARRAKSLTNCRLRSTLILDTDTVETLCLIFKSNLSKSLSAPAMSVVPPGQYRQSWAFFVV